METKKELQQPKPKRKYIRKQKIIKEQLTRPTEQGNKNIIVTFP
jgi:hypothetical protein